MDALSTPATADFSSTPPKRTKIVLLGDQSVGKTSLITRSALDANGVLALISMQIHVRYIRQHLPSYDWHRLLEQNHVLGGPDRPITIVGYRWTGKRIFEPLGMCSCRMARM